MNLRSLRRVLTSRAVVGTTAAIVLLLLLGAYVSVQDDLAPRANAVAAAAGASDRAVVATAASPMASIAPMVRKASAEQATFQTAAAPPATTRLIRTAQLEIQVQSVVRAMTSADSIAKARDALIADSRSSEAPDGPRDAQFVVRVPATRFTETLIALRGLGQVRNEGIGTQDVTRAYADLETRIAVKRETVARLRTLLTQHTGKLSDVLDVERELSRTVTELEQMEGEQRYYDSQLAVSSISVHVYEQPPVIRASFMEPIVDAARRAIDVFSSSVALLVFAVTFLAPWTIVAGAGWWIVRRYPIWTRRA